MVFCQTGHQHQTLGAHIGPVLASLHWLPVKCRVDFKILTMTFKALNALTPPYIVDLLDLSSTSRSRPSLRSDSQLKLNTPRTSLVTKGDRAFSVSAPNLWNKLPLNIKASPTLETFKARLKTHLFNAEYNT